MALFVWLVALMTLPGLAFGTVIQVLPSAGGEGIQKALDTAPHGAEVELEAGTYLVHQPIILDHDGETLRGTGETTILYLADNANCPVVVLGSPVDKPSGPVEQLSLSNLMIDGNRKHQKTEVWRSLHEGGLYNNGIDVWYVDGVSVKNIVCCRCRSGGLVSTAKTRRLTVSGYTAFDNQFDGLACYFTEDSIFTNLDLHDNLGAGISLDLNFNHNVIDGAVLTGNDLGVFMRHSRNNTFQGVTIRKSRHHGVFMAQEVQGKKHCPGTECTGNIFEKMLVTNCGGDAFLVNDATCINNTISSCQFLDNAGGLSQAKTNPITVRDVVEHDTPTMISAVIAPLIKPMAHPTTISAVTQ
ncbi:MAG TPA: right-handed parallel beta-helix repeat-containing protein [Verrucomicrobiae bacterium]